MPLTNSPSTASQTADWPIAIMTLDGGGMRGIYQARALQELVRVSPRLLDDIIIFAGTSTGAIVASALAATHMGPARLVELYRRLGTQVFGRHLKRAQYYARTALGIPAYSATRLKACFDEWFEGKPFHKCRPRVLATAISVNKQQLVLLDSEHPAYRNIALADVLLSSTAAPTFFPAHFVTKLSGYYIDAGLGCNNPAIEVIRTLLDTGISRENIHLLSIGTCTALKTHFDQSSTSSSLWSWGKRSLDITMRTSSRVVDDWCGTFFGDNSNYIRIDSQLEKEIPLDSCDKNELDTLCALAVDEVNSRRSEILSWHRTYRERL